MREIGVGLIGYGLGGQAFHAPYVEVTPGLKLRAIVSRAPAKVHAQRPFVHVLPTVEALLAESGIDLVIVSSPDALHAQHAMAALAAGKHVVVDKPFAVNLADAREVAKTANASHQLLTVFHNRRWDADFLTLRRLVEGGHLGRIVHFESHFDRWTPEPRTVWKEAREGGSWLDLGPHLVDQALCLLGRPQSVSANFARMREAAPATDYFHVVLSYPGCKAILHSSKLARDHALRFAVHGTEGSWIKTGFDVQEQAVRNGKLPASPDWGHDPIEGRLTRASSDISTSVLNERGDYRIFWRSLVAAIRGEAPNPVPVNEALAVMEVLDAGLTSGRKGQVIAM